MNMVCVSEEGLGAVKVCQRRSCLVAERVGPEMGTGMEQRHIPWSDWWVDGGN